MSDYTPSNLPARLTEKISQHESGCWNWIACRHTNGYGKLGYQGRTWLAHRCVYTILVGDIPDGLVLDHVCRNRLCVNPSHLRPCTNRENILAPGSQSPSALQAQRTACQVGHPLSGDNLYLYEGKRDCLTCRRERTRRSNERRRAA